MNNSKFFKYKLFLIGVLSIILGTFMGISYAHYDSFVEGNQNAKANVVTTDRPVIKIENGSTINNENMMPGDTITKTFTVENINSSSANYSIVLKDVVNELDDPSDFTYQLISNDGGYNTQTDQRFPIGDYAIVDNYAIGANVTHTYTLILKFVNKTTSQNSSMEKEVSATIQLDDGTFEDQIYNVTYLSDNLVYGLDDTNGVRTGYAATWSITNGVLEQTATSNDGFAFNSGRVYLESGKTYVFNCDTDNEDWAGASVEAYLMLNQQYVTYYRMYSNKNYEFIPSATGTYYLRLDVNKNGQTNKFWNISVREKLGTKEIVYDKPYGNLLTPTKSGKTFKGWNGKNLFNMRDWLSSFSSVHNGTYESGDNWIKITANSYDAFTDSSHSYKFNVKTNTVYSLSWEVDDNSKKGLPYVFINEKYDSGYMFNGNTNNQKYFSFKTPNDAQYLTSRFGTVYTGDSITYSNIQLEEGSTATEYEPYYISSTTKVTRAYDHYLYAEFE